MQAPPIPTICRTGDAVHDRNYDAIQEAFKRLGKMVAPVVNQSATFNVQTQPAAIADGLMQTGVQLATTVAGIIPEPTRNTIVVTVDSGGQVYGIVASALKTGTFLRIVFVNACKVVNAAPVPAGAVPFRLGTMDGAGYDIDWTLPSPQAGGRIGVTYYASELAQSPCFQLVEGPTI